MGVMVPPLHRAQERSPAVCLTEAVDLIDEENGAALKKDRNLRPFCSIAAHILHAAVDKR